MNVNRIVLTVNGVIRVITGQENIGVMPLWTPGEPLSLFRWAFLAGGVKRGYQVDPRFKISNWDTGSKDPVQVKRIPLVEFAPGIYKNGKDLWWSHGGRIYHAKGILGRL